MSLRLALDEQHDEGYTEGKAEGRAEGKVEGILISIRNLMLKMNVTAQQAMEMLMVPADKQPKYLEQIETLLKAPAAI